MLSSTPRNKFDQEEDTKIQTCLNLEEEVDMEETAIGAEAGVDLGKLSVEELAKEIKITLNKRRRRRP